MRSLKEYLIESNVSEAAECTDSKTFTFDFTDIENGEETVKSFEGKENYAIDGNKVTVTICKDKETDTEILQQAVQSIRKQQKNSSNEQYAQKTKKLEVTLGELFDYQDELENQEDLEEKVKKEEE